MAAGENVVTVAVFRLGRMAQVGCRLDTDAALTVRAPLAAGLTEDVRSNIEAQVSSIRLARDVFYGEHEVGFRLGVAPDPAAPLTARLFADSGEQVAEIKPAAAGPVSLGRERRCRTATTVSRAPGPAPIGSPLTSTSYAIHKVTPIPAMPGLDRMAERKRIVLEHYAGFLRKELGPTSGAGRALCAGPL